MNRKIIIFCIAVVFGILQSASGQDLEKNFITPPNSAKPQAWWHWMSGHVTKEGIKKDLEIMADLGIGGVQIFEVRHRKLPEGPLPYYSEEWHETFLMPGF